jgi:NHL repeat
MRRVVVGTAVLTVVMAVLGSPAPATAADPGFQFLTAWGSLGSGEGEFNAIQEVEVTPGGEVYTVETGNQRVQRFSADGDFKLRWGNPGPGGSAQPGQFNGPQDIAVGADSRVYVADADNHRIQWFTPEGVLGGAWGTSGTGNGEFEDPTDLATAPDGSVYVADFNNGRIQRFNRDGTFLNVWGSDGAGPGQFSWITGLSVAPDGTVYVVEQENRRVQRFTATGALLNSWGTPGSGPGQFLSPSAIDVGADGRVYVVDKDRDDVQVFGPTGDYQESFGGPGSGGGKFEIPTGIAVSRFGTVYVADNNQERVHWFGNLDATTDTDGDALPDLWEILGYDRGGDGTVDVDLPEMGADPYHKDVFVEIDWMTNHQLDGAAIAQVVAAFEQAPVNNPAGGSGISLHVDNGSDSVMTGTKTWGQRSESDELNHVKYLTVWGGFDAGKPNLFTAARRPIFHYAVSAHQYDSTTSSGISRGIPASDLVVSLGAFCAGGLDCSGTTAEQAGTFMHELGHNLGLHHGGGDDVNYKPNFLSVMNYSFQLAGLVRDGTAGVFDYSMFPGGSQTLPDLDETSLSETTGIGGAGSLISRYTTTWHCSGAFVTGPLTGGADFDCDGKPGETVSTDINSDGQKTILSPWNDWDHIVFDGGQVGDAAGVALPDTMWPKEPSAKKLRATQKVLLKDAKRPKVSIRIKSRGRVVVKAKDNKALDRVIVKVDRKTKQVRVKGSKVKTVKLQVKRGKHRIKAAALDSAGNSSKTARRTVRR